MKGSSAIREQFFLWALILGLWGLLVLAFAGQLVFTSPLPWQQALALALRDWLPWVPLAPAVAWLAFRFPIERRKLALSIPVHVLACMAAVLFCQFVARRDHPPPGPLPGGPRFRFRGAVPEDGPPLQPLPPRPADLPRDRLPPPPPEVRRMAFLNALVMQGKFNIPIYWVVVSIVHAFTYYRRSQERERKALELEASLAQARLQALRMQLHPPFLFNTLHAISTLVHKDPQAADEMIGNLSELLRVTLDTSDQQQIPLRKELDFLDRYLQIQQTRFGDRLLVEKQIDANALDAQVRTLILQPLVENAIRHGIEPHPAPGRVAIQIERRNDLLHLVVRNTCAGPKASPQSQEGIGIANTKARLHELYGDRARLTLTTSSEAGFRVDIEIPYCES